MKNNFYISLIISVLAFTASCSKYDPIKPIKSKNSIETSKTFQNSETVVDSKPITDPENEEDVDAGVSITDPENEEDKFSN